MAESHIPDPGLQIVASSILAGGFVAALDSLMDTKIVDKKLDNFLNKDKIDKLRGSMNDNIKLDNLKKIKY